MSENTIIVRDLLDLSVIAVVGNITNPLISEQINAHLTFDFETVFDENTKIINDAEIVEVDNNYFNIARIVKNRNTLTMSVYCEHVSYDMMQFSIPFKEIEDTAENILIALLDGTADFEVGTVSLDEADKKYYFEPKSDNLRGAIIELANLVGGELIFDKYNVSLVQQRGVISNQEFKLGENLIGVIEEIDAMGDHRKSIEVDVIDLSQIEGYEYLQTIGLGDTVRVIDPVLEIDETLRVVSKEYNPFQKINPRVQIGQVIRDITDYLKEEPEEEEEIDPTANYYLSKFNIGSQDCLKVSGVEIDNDLALPEGISASLEYSSNNQYTGVFIELKSQYSSYFITVYKVLKDGKFETFDYSTQSAIINAWLLPTEDIVGIGVIVTKTPFATFDATKDDFRQYGVNFTKLILDPFREFKIGTVNCLTLTDLALDTTATLPEDIKAEIQYEELNELTGLFLSLKKEFASWYIQIQTFDKTGAITTYNFVDIKDTVKTWTLPNDNVMVIAVNVMEKPPSEFVEGTHLKQVYGMKFKQIEKPPEPYLSEFRVDDIDCLSFESIMQDLKTATVETQGATYEYQDRTFNGLFLALKEEFANCSVKMWGIYEDGTIAMGEIPLMNLGTPYAGLNYLNGYTFPLGSNKIAFEITIMVSETVDVNELNYGSEGQLYKVKFVDKSILNGLITIYCYDETDTFETIEIAVSEVGIYDIVPPEFEGYELDEEEYEYVPKTVKITKDSPTVQVWIGYKKLPPEAPKGYTLEFATAPLYSTIDFAFENEDGYDIVESIVTSLIGSESSDVNLIAEPIKNTTTNKYTGIRVRASMVASGTKVSVQAVCYNGVT